MFDYLELWKFIGVLFYTLNILLKVVNDLNLYWFLFCDKWGRKDIKEKRLSSQVWWTQAYNPSTWEVITRRSSVQDQPAFHDVLSERERPRQRDRL